MNARSKSTVVMPIYLGIARSRPRFLDKEQIRLARRLWAEGLPQQAIAREIGVSTDVLKSRLADQLKTLPRNRKTIRPKPEGDIPEAEIARRAALVRHQWSEEQRDSRREVFKGHRPES